MRVLGLVHQYIPVRCAGAESHVHTMLAALAAAGHHVDVVLSHQVGQPYDYEGVHVHPAVDVRTDANPYVEEADLIVTHLGNTTRANVLGKFNDVPVVAVHHNDFPPTRDALVMPWARTDLVVTNSHWMTDSLVAWGIDNQVQLPPIQIVRPAANPFVYGTTPGDRVTLVNLRRLGPADPDGLTKGGEVFRALAERMPRTKFLGVTGAYGVQEELAHLPNVEVLEHVPHDQMRERVYGHTKVLLVPSNYESWGRVASEAITSGIPTIASPTPGLVEQLGEAGTFVDHDDIDGWEAALRALLKPAAWRRASEVALNRAGQLDVTRRSDMAEWVAAAERTVATGGFHPRALQEYLI